VRGWNDHVLFQLVTFQALRHEANQVAKCEAPLKPAACVK